jgi:signal transduction histidine kinase
VHELVQAHGGTVAVDSSAERGTTFSVFLPLAAQGAAATPRATERAN